MRKLMERLRKSSIPVCCMAAAGVMILCAASFGQDAGELAAETQKFSSKAPHPLLAIEAAHPAALKPELLNVHPRVFFTAAEIEKLRERAATTHKAIWQRALANMICTHQEPAPAPAQERRAQNDVGLGIAEAAFAYSIERDPKYLAIAKKFMDAAVSYDVWGYTSNKPNVDLAAGHLLYGLSMGYDLLYNDLSPAEREKYRDKLVKQGNLLYKSYVIKPGKRFAYSQNHLFIPAAGLGVAAYALYGEVPEAAKWATCVRALYDRVLATYSADGYYYEGFEYWVFSTPWIVHYLDALGHSTGEDLYDQAGLRNTYKYVAATMLPDGKNVFDFGDVFSGPLTRSGKADDYERTHPGGHLHSNYILLYRLAQRFQSGEAQGVADWLASLQQNNFEDYWALAWYDPTIKAVPITEQPTMQNFEDSGVVYWRSGWDSGATALAFKCGPPEGHHAAEIAETMPDWRQSQGHAHPDAGSFILYGNGQYLTGTSGYAGVPTTAANNTLLVNGKGQAREGHGHDAFAEVPLEHLNNIRIAHVAATPGGVTVEGDATSAYEPDRGVESFTRSLHLENHTLSIMDEVTTSKPATLSILFHFDGDAIPAGLTVVAEKPANAVERMEPNILTAPGAPGSVDKGPKEQRGSRLSISTPAAVVHETFETLLKW